MAFTFSQNPITAYCDTVADIDANWPDDMIVVILEDMRMYRMLGGVAVMVAPPILTIPIQASIFTPVLSTTRYFGLLPDLPTATAGERKIYVRAPGIITAIEIYTRAVVAGGSNDWSMYLRLNNTTDTLIETVGVSSNERVFKNSSMSVAVVDGDYFEIKSVHPAWIVAPTSVALGGYVLIQNG